MRLKKKNVKVQSIHSNNLRTPVPSSNKMSVHIGVIVKNSSMNIHNSSLIIIKKNNDIILYAVK